MTVTLEQLNARLDVLEQQVKELQQRAVPTRRPNSRGSSVFRNPELRALVDDMIRRQAPVREIRAACVERFGNDVPSLSAITRYRWDYHTKR